MTMHKWLLSEASRIKNLFSLWLVFWLSIITSTFYYILVNSGESLGQSFINLHLISTNIFLPYGVMGLIALIGLFIFIVKPSTQLNKQEIHKQPSWVFYSYWGLINAFLLWSAVSLSSTDRELWLFGLYVSFAIILVKCSNEFWGEKIDLTFKHFSAGTIGIEGDMLDFKSSAKNVSDGLLHLKNYVNVIGLYGGLGFGKSSYARMIVESLDEKRVLYTYISLTETSEAKDFSKLFAERWLGTLAGRYPKIDITSALPFMDSILRESGNGVLSDFLKAVSVLNRGLLRTKAFFFDEFYSKKKSTLTSEAVAKLFGNITEIKEPLWIIMIDEIERAQFDEIYRLVEIVERFKSEGRSGLPTKLLFLFCISEPELENYLNMYVATDPRPKLLHTFFYEDPKSITHKIFLPAVEPAVKQKYVFDLLNKVIDREGIDAPTGLNVNAIVDPARSFMSHKDALEYTIAILQENSPRIINRVATALDFFYGAFRNRAGEMQKNAIRFNDILTLEYIKIKYPYLMDFFVKTVHILVNQAEAHNLDAYFTRERLEKNKIDLIGWIELVTDRKILESEKPDILKMVGLVMYYYFDFLNKDYETKSKDKYFGTTSYPEIMGDYLSLMAEGVETNYRKNNRIYQNHKSNLGGLISSLDTKELISYTRFLFDVPSAPVQLNVDLIQELCKRIVTQKIKPDPMNVEDTALDESIYQFVFQIVAVTEKDNESDSPSEFLQKSFGALKAVLSSSKVNTGLKYIILSSLVNHERGGVSTIHGRLQSAFSKILVHYNNEMRELIKAVFKEYRRNYVTGKKILYRYEENFFYTLYQGWSGSKDDKEEIERIRIIAKRGLKRYPKAIKLFWRKYPFTEGWKTLKDVFDGDHFFSMSDTNNPLYMPLETLIAITKEAKIKDPEIHAKLKFWESIKDTPRLKEMSIIKDDQSTLRSFLIRNGFLD